MQIAVASGKGGTGKTTLATNLAHYLKKITDKKITLLDCDVDEPNSHLFLHPRWTEEWKVTLPVPVYTPTDCSSCGMCADICQYGALALIKDKILVFPELCHGCGGCLLVCPTRSLTESEREIGHVQKGEAKGGILLYHGLLRIGEAMSPPLIRSVKEYIDSTAITIIDCPPGTSCPVIQSIKGSDFVLLVTEPTPFGLNDLKLSVDMVRALKIPFALVINRSTLGDRSVWKYCQNEGIKVLAEIPNDRSIAMAYSKGRLILEYFPEYEDYLAQTVNGMKEVLPW